MMNERHQPKHFAETMKDSCNYCHRIPAIWQYAGSEKVCAHCGTRVFNSTGSTSGSLLTKPSHR
jgi:hypothetical protein